jgi:hypothetical protein
MKYGEFVDHRAVTNFKCETNYTCWHDTLIKIAINSDLTFASAHFGANEIHSPIRLGS